MVEELFKYPESSIDGMVEQRQSWMQMGSIRNYMTSMVNYHAAGFKLNYLLCQVLGT